MSKEQTSLLKKLKATRAQVRRQFTLAVTKIQDTLEKGEATEQLNEEYALLQEKASRLFKIDDSVAETYLQIEADDEEMSKEFEEAEHYRDLNTVTVSRYDAVIRKNNVDVNSVQSSARSGDSHQLSRTRLKLPQLVPIEFDGNLRNWIAFWAVFKRIHESDEFDDGEKFQYLIMYTAEGSPARELVQSFPPSAGNYNKAVKQLQSRFGREELLIELYVRELLSLVLLQARGEGFQSVRSLYDQLETQLRALETLGVARDKYTHLLTPLIESALPEPILKEWERSITLAVAPVAEREEAIHLENDKMQRLLSFLRQEAESEERMKLARHAFSDCETKSSTKKNSFSTNKSDVRDKIASKSRVPTAAGLVNVKQQKATAACAFCDGSSHESADCFAARERPLDELRDVMKRKGLCFFCLKRGHCQRTCRASVRCIICSGRHVPLLCKDRKQQPAKGSPSKEPVEHTLSNSYLFKTPSNTGTVSVLMQTLRVRIRGFPGLTARVLFDSGSQRSYITKELAGKMKGVPIGEMELKHALFGGSVSGTKKHKCYKLRIEGLDGKYACNFEVLDSDCICQAVPSVPVGELLEELKQQGIKLADLQGGPIDVLIGADVIGNLLSGRKIEMENGLVAIHTHLGWTLMGKIPKAVDNFWSHISLFSKDFSVQDLWRLEAIGIEDSSQVKSKEQRTLTAREHFRETVRVLDNGRYQIKLPWLEDHPPLPRNFNLAMRRFESTVRRLKATGNELNYAKIFEDWLQAGIIEEVPREEWDEGHYLPHRPVYKPGSTTPIRPVFDASARERGHPSLNQCLEIGPNLIELIPRMLVRFRRHRIGIIADIRKAFLQISVNPDDRNFLRFIWMREDGQTRIFRHARVVFGVCCSPFLLGSVLDHHLNLCLQKIREGKLPYSEPIIQLLQECLYVDNFVSSLNKQEDIDTFVNQASEIFKIACFDLRGWTFSNPSLTESSKTAVLGILWDEKKDVLRIKVPNYEDLRSVKVTKRTLMSSTQRLFDPIGITAPVSITPKRLVQEAWKAGGEWDTPVDSVSSDIFINWLKEINCLEEIEFCRWLSNYEEDRSTSTLHIFCDASQTAYAAAIFLRVESKGNVIVRLVAAKARIAPMDRITIPRLELLAATVGARLCHHLEDVLPMVSAKYYWSDSMTTLTWIKKDEPWGVFVRNRVEEIRRLSDPACWNHVPGSENPADLPSRGCSPKALVQSKWWEGPQWLRLPINEWPSVTANVNEEEVMQEQMKRITVISLDFSLSEQLLSERISHYWKILRVVGWIVRFRKNAQRGVGRSRGRLNLNELNIAEKWIIRLVQQEAFQGSSKVHIQKLKPQESEDGLLRLRTKIWARKDTEDFRAPMILPSDHPIVERLIMHIHCQNGHIVGQHLLNVLRERFWLIKGRRTVRKVISKCLICKRYAAENLTAESPPLPQDRVRDAKVFEVTGTDYAGPLYLADGTKVWICLFTCAIYRAVHLDIVNALTTESFMLAFRRFVARRGRPSVMYSDNGTNFRGMKNALDHVDWNEILKYSHSHQIEWRFNPPTAAWWGGFWERMIGVLKSLLRKNLGRASLKHDELYTVICDCEALINSRPITYVSENPQDPTPISPQMFLQELREIGVPDCDQIDTASLSRRLKHRQAIQEELRQRFRAEYLGQLRLISDKRGTSREPVVGELVLIGSDSSRRLSWPLAVVEETVRGKDGHIRVVYLRTAEGRLCRPIQRIFPLELGCELDQGGEESAPDPDKTVEDPAAEESGSELQDTALQQRKIRGIYTKCGRAVKLPVRYQ